MIGTTLCTIRTHIEALASETGTYYLVCGRYGDRPVPAADLRFENRATARAAAHATEQYREALRRYDPQLPYYDVIVCQDAAPATTIGDVGSRPTEPERGPHRRAESIVADRPDRSGRREDRGQSLVEFCHTVAGALFETIAASSHETVERAIMDTYLERAETIDSPDELCLRLLESMASELDRQLTPSEQARVLLTAAAQLSPASASGNPLDSTLSHLCSVALASDYTLQRRPPDRHGRPRSWDVTISGYALDGIDDRLATLPLVVDLFRHQPHSNLAISRAERGGDGSVPSTWCFRLTTAADGEPTGLVSVPEGSSG